MSKKSKRNGAQKGPKPDFRVHHVRSVNGFAYKFVDKHHHPPKGDHACWLKAVSRNDEFGLFNDADRSNLSDECGNLYNVSKHGDEYLEIGTRHELLAIFWNPHSASEWHGHPLWPIRVKGSFNRKNEQYRPPHSAMQRMVEEARMSERDAARILRGQYP